MKILQFIQKPQLRGAELFACQLSEHLKQQGHEVIIVALFPGDAQLPFTGKQCFLNRSPKYRLVDVIGLKKIHKLIGVEHPDIVQANAGDTLKYLALSKKIFRWKVPIVFRNASVISLYLNSWLAKLANDFFFQEVAFVISVSEASRTDLIRLFPFLSNRVTVIPVGVNNNESSPLQARKPYLLHVGGFSFEKNHVGLLRIFKRVLSRIDIDLWLVGTGQLKEHVERQVVELGLSERVKFLGFRTDVADIMRSAKALLLPSTIEGLPAVILEAMQVELPVVAYAVGGIHEIVKSGETGWLVAAGDEIGFSEAVIQAINSTKLDQIKQNARQLVVRKYDNSFLAKQFGVVYSALIQKSL